MEGWKLANTGASIKASDDGALFNTFANNKDYIIKDIAEEFEITYQSGSLDVNVGSGKAVIGGRGAYAEESGSLTLPANSTIWLCLRADLTQIQGQELMLYANTSEDISQDNLNDGTNGVRDLLLAIVETDSNGITDVQDKRVIKDSSSNDVITENTLFNISGLEFKIVKVND